MEVPVDVSEIIDHKKISSKLNITIICDTDASANSVMKEMSANPYIAPLLLQDNCSLNFELKTPSIFQLHTDSFKLIDCIHQVVKGSGPGISSITGTVCSLSMKCTTAREANIVRNTLVQDKGPKRSNSSKTLRVDDDVFYLEITAPDVREVRTALNSFMDLLCLTMQTINNFGPAFPTVKKSCS